MNKPYRHLLVCWQEKDKESKFKSWAWYEIMTLNDFDQPIYCHAVKLGLGQTLEQVLGSVNMQNKLIRKAHDEQSKVYDDYDLVARNVAIMAIASFDDMQDAYDNAKSVFYPILLQELMLMENRQN